MMTTPLLALTLALAPTNTQNTVQLWAAGGVFVRHSDYSFGSLRSGSEDVVGGAALGGANFFLRPVHDDAAAPSLQPFLQRTGSFWFSGGGGSNHISESDDPVGGSDMAQGQLNLGVDGYFGPNRAVYGAASFGFRYFAISDPTITLAPEVRLGGRIGEALITVSYGLAPVKLGKRDFDVPFYGNVGLQVYGIVGRKLELSASADALLDGGEGRVAATRWLARRFGIGAALFGGHESTYPFRQTHEFLGGEIDFTAWVTRRFALQASYQPQWNSFYGRESVANSGGLTHAIVLGITARP